MNKKILDKLNEHFSSSKTELYSKGKVLTFANQEPHGVSFLVEGVVEQYDVTPEGNKITVNVFRPPAFFPMSWAVNKTPNTYFFAALTDVKLKRADADKTVEFIQNNPDVLFDLLSRVYKGTDALLKRLVVTARNVAMNRLVFEILIESYRFGVKQDDNKCFIKIKQSVLAARSGLARETVSRELHKLEADGLISFKDQGILIDTELLEKKMELTS